MRLLLLCLRQQCSGRRFLEAAAKVLLAHEFVFNQDLRRLVLGASGLNHLPDKQLSRQPLCEATNKLIIAINQPAEMAADEFVSGVRLRQRWPQISENGRRKTTSPVSSSTSMA